MRLKEISSEVYVADEPIVRLGREEMAWLKRKVLATPRGRARICAHRDNRDPLHEMLIALAQTTYIRPHKHLNKSESFHIIEGAVDVVALDDAGRITEIIPLGEPGSCRNFFYRLAAPVFHTLLIHSPVLILHETTNGPFTPGDALFAPWAPPETDAAAARAYLENLAKAAAGLAAAGPGRA